MVLFATLVSAALLVSACSGGTSFSSGPFAPQADTSEGLTNLSSDLMAVLEGGALAGSCDAYWSDVSVGDATRRQRLLCGKEMFFYEGFDTVGVPTVLLTTMLDLFPNQLGPGASGVGMIPDPTSETGLPLGFGPGRESAEGVPALAFTCASCHFGQLSDGRYAVGAPNHDYEYGEMDLASAVLPLSALLGTEPEPSAAAVLAPYLAEMEADPTIETRMLAALAPLAGSGVGLPDFTPELQSQYAAWKPGTMDFVIVPLPIDDGVHTVSKIMSLWGIASDDEVDAFGMDGALLGHTGVSTSVLNFLQGFVVLGGGDTEAWTDERLGPLEDFLLSLRAPDNLSPPPADLADRGAELFVSAGCADCHDGARGSSRVVYGFDEIGTDAAMQRWLDPDLDGRPCCDIDLTGRDSLTGGIRAQRLVGVWSAKRLLHNGSIDTLEALFCLGTNRPTITASPFSDQGHPYTCDNLTNEEKQSLIAHLRTL
ncbi:MAG: hypothetical protein AAF500_10635 [Myxococcota bacterium]